MAREAIDKDGIIGILNSILEMELAGVVRYAHYALMVFGHARIPITSWMRDQATEALQHATLAGEHVTTLGGHPSLKIGRLLETHQHSIDAILRETLEHEQEGIALYMKLLEAVTDKSVALEEYARTMVAAEEQHVAEVEKMLRKPGSLEPVG